MLSEYKEPPEVALTKPVPKELMVVEPLGKTENNSWLVEEATANTDRALVVLLPCTTKGELGVEEPIPTLPPAVTLKNVKLEEDAILKTSKVGLVEVPCTTKVALGEVEAILNWLEK